MADASLASFAGNVAIVAAALYGPQVSAQFSTFFAAAGLPVLEPPPPIVCWIPAESETTSEWSSIDDG